ncbi:glycerophosphodiester phosphodiesterase [Asanoa iriomotensis]|uniref:Glycerophosphoryl diester phosphodiesterase n=1 Tax=Asanoa iriomotensis TaxID=234613 RepID=A0ABQ4CE84_9ACTN|nr:glycerophosphodiester phosphodiesterase [Asanoa iriomotensis]GIF61087.1 glycerophosphoryl diester phosphodiesterase [Asanoa iriomotensis]
MGESPLIFAHRGSSAVLPEHTLPAYQKAIEEGADGVECDVRLTRDGHLVCVHDRRLDRTSNGKGRVSRHTLAELDTLEFGSWSSRTGTDVPADPDRARLLTLDRLLGMVRDAGRELQVLIETKHPTHHGGDVERALAALLRRHGLDQPRDSEKVAVTVMSFSALAVRRMRELAPGLPTALLMELLPSALRGTLPFGARIAGPGLHLVKARPRLVRTLQAAGNKVYVWTANEADEIDFLVDLGVDGIITDRPAFVLQHIGR